MDEFTQAYLDCALWSTNDESGEPLDASYGIEDLDPDTLAQMVEDCKQFQEENVDDIATYPGVYTPEEMAGHDFFLTRNGHGSGYWDGDWPKDVGERLTKASKAFGEVYLYVEDGKIYSEG